MEKIKNEVKRFLLATEEKLSIDVQRTEAPLLFATTENTFTAEGWIPTVLLHELNEKLEESVGSHMAIEERERAEYDAEGFVEHGESVGQAKVEGDTKMGRSEPPVIQDNPTSVQPFEVLVQTIGRPKYSELDPTLIIFLTFPAFFGFMIGDVGYGICYAIIGYLLMSKSDSIGIKSLGGVTIWAGIFTILFGVFYGEFFGMHIVGELIWGGHPPIEKGLSPKTAHFALLWLVVAMLIGIVHVSIGYTIDFINKMRHSIVDAVLESGSWILLMLGVWTWVFSTPNIRRIHDPLSNTASTILCLILFMKSMVYPMLTCTIPINIATTSHNRAKCAVLGESPFSIGGCPPQINSPTMCIPKNSP
jgi:V/A-type H+-transporting ATPase subunit I